MRPLQWSALEAVAAKYTAPQAQPATRPQLHVTFICTGNICRSPMAEVMFSQQIRDRGLGDKVRVSSAGTHAYGLISDPRTGRVLQRHGYTGDHEAALVSKDHLNADLVVAMAGQHAWDLSTLGVSRERLRLLRTFDPSNPSHVDVDDPFYSGDFESTYAAVEAALPGLHRWVDDWLTQESRRGTERGCAAQRTSSQA